MKQYWQRIALKIDALTQRERAIVFALAVALAIALLNAVLLDPQAAKRRQLSRQLTQNQAKMLEIQAELQQWARADAMDPDTANRTRLEELKRQSAQMHSTLQEMQKGIVPPDKMSDLLQSMLRQNGKLHLVSLKTLEAAGLTESLQPAAKDKTESKSLPDAVYKHGVELEIQGSYADLTSYLTSLEALPWQLYWGSARLKVEEYPKATLVLTVFTLSLDRKWLNT